MYKKNNETIGTTRIIEFEIKGFPYYGDHFFKKQVLVKWFFWTRWVDIKYVFYKTKEYIEYNQECINVINIDYYSPRYFRNLNDCLEYKHLVGVGKSQNPDIEYKGFKIVLRRHILYDQVYKWFIRGVRNAYEKYKGYTEFDTLNEAKKYIDDLIIRKNFKTKVVWIDDKEMIK